MSDDNVTQQAGPVTVTLLVRDQGFIPTRIELRQSDESFEAYVGLIADRVEFVARTLAEAVWNALQNPQVTLLRLGEVNKAVFNADINFDRSQFPPNPAE